MAIGTGKDPVRKGWGDFPVPLFCGRILPEAKEVGMEDKAKPEATLEKKRRCKYGRNKNTGKCLKSPRK